MDNNNYGQILPGQDTTDENLPKQPPVNPVAQSPLEQISPKQQTVGQVPQNQEPPNGLPVARPSGELNLSQRQPINQFPSSQKPPEKPPVIETPKTNTTNKSNPAKIFRNSIKNKNNTAIFVVVFTVIIIMIVSAVILFGGSESQNVTTNEAPEVLLPDSDSANQEAVEAPLVGVEMDSVLKSTNNGLSFETFFFLVTDKQLGSVDVLNISFHPTNEGEIVVSTYDDGLFTNKDSSVNKWETIAFPPQKIYSFIIDKYDPDHRAFASGVIVKNGRIFRTDDKGESWRAVYAEPGDSTYVSALTQNPINQNIIIAGTSGGTLIRSIDGGDTWNNIGQDISGKITSFTHDSIGSSLTYLLARGGEIYYSNDSGLNWQNWEDVKKEEIDNLNDRANELRKAGDKNGYTRLKEQATALKDKNREQKTPSGIITIVADPGTSGVLYAGLKKGLYRSVDYGKYWKQVNIIESAERFPITSIAINPDNSDEISFVAGNSFYRSVNKGITWAVTPLDKTRNASFVAYDPFDTDIIYIGLSAKK